MKNAVMNVRSMLYSLRRILTLFVVFAAVLVTLPLQANAQEWTTTSTTAYDTADEDDWATESTSEPVEQRSATSKASKTSAAHPDDYAEEPALSDVTEPGEGMSETLAPSETLVPGELSELTEAPLVTEMESEPEIGFGPQSLRSAFGMLGGASDMYTGTSDDPNFWWYQHRERNNEIAPRCGLKVGLVFDLSGSIGEDGLRNSQKAGKRVVDSLRGSAGTQLGIFTFNTNSETIHPGFDMATEVSKANTAIDRLKIGQGNSAGTNWEGGLKQVNDAAAEYGDYNIVYFITDGVPTTNNTANYRTSPQLDLGTITHNGDIANAIREANKLKSAGTKVEVLAVNMGESTHPVLRDEVLKHDNVNYYGESYYTNVNELGSFYNSGQLNENKPKYRWGFSSFYSAKQRDDAIGAGALIYQSSELTVMAGADITAIRKPGTKTISVLNGRYLENYFLPAYNLNRPTGRQMAFALTNDFSSVTEVNYDQLAETLEAMLPRPCIAELKIEKEVVDQVGQTDKATSVGGWEFKMGSLPDEFSFRSDSKDSVTTDNKGVAQWSFKTESPDSNGTVEITENVRNGTNAKLQNVVCRDGDNKEIQVNHDGQKFTIKLEAGGRYSCKVTNQIPGFEVEKTAAADQNLDVPGNQPVAVVDAQGNFTVRYQIKITNLSDSKNTLNKPIKDTPRFPNGFTVVNADFKMNNGRPVGVKHLGDRWELTLIDGHETFNTGGAIKFINVVLTGKANAAAQQSINNGTYKNCEAGGGLKNQVSMDGDLDKTNNEACVDVTIEDILLKLLKVDHNEVSQALGGAQFTLFKANGDQIGEQVAVFEPGSKDGSHSTRVELGAEYFIVETRAPDNYSLLPAPIRIAVNAGQNGIEVKVLNPNEAFSATPKVSEEPGVAILQVADLQSGALPKSGGMGVVPFAIVALLILGLGAYMLRRRM